MPGQVYNILFVVARNGTAQTFDASSGFQVRFPSSNYTVPILTGNEQWKPGQRFVFYVLTKMYYPLPSEQHSGFEFDLGGARSVAIPGPSAIALRIKYDPATFSRTLDSIVAFGPGNQGGIGREIWPAQHSHQRVPLRANQSKRFRRLFLVDLGVNRTTREPAHEKPDRQEAIMPLMSTEETVDRGGLVMKGSTAWPSTLAMALLLSWVAPDPVRGPDPGLADAATNSAPGDLPGAGRRPGLPRPSSPYPRRAAGI